MATDMAGPGAPTKPTVFLSHAVTDEPIAKVIHDEIRRIFAGGVNVFASSVPGVVKPGTDWLKEIRVNLTLLRPSSSSFLPFLSIVPGSGLRSGASWSRMEDGEGVILPVCVPEVLEEAADIYPVKAWKTENTIRFAELDGEEREKWDEKNL